ncbi:hypothetical protein [Mycoplasmopsis primatum]|uniref:hypothetical protein n=1 Tax=Mycoplasmopsis primatum TaxID=55604 RepID=UPI00068F546D|nr:hypothetical protein [Mycoplasmopsis primatum]
MTKNTKNQIRLRAFNFLSQFGDDIRTKLSNICGKTAQYDIPTELFQKRTHRSNRILLPWKSVKNNNLTLDQLNTFSNGVVVEFVNEDFFDKNNQANPIFCELRARLGSNENVSSMISIRSESGSSSSKVQRDNFKKLISNTKVTYKGETIILNKYNYQNYAIKRIEKGGRGNSNWSGFLFVSIKGGQQDTIETHKGKVELLFNPACEYASDDVCLDVDLVISYFALMSVDKNALKDDEQLKKYNNLLSDIETVLSESFYDNDSYKGNLLKYCKNHPSLRLEPGKLFDPIQVEQIDIENFGIKEKENPKCLDFTHDEAVNLDKFYWDRIKKCILSATRPCNVFWSKHLSNMMQQNFSLVEYFEHEEQINKRRKEKLK